MAWTWQMETSDGVVVHPDSVDVPEFPNRGDAESWVGEVFGELVQAGVDQVRLFEDEAEVYGPMSLHPDG